MAGVSVAQSMRFGGQSLLRKVLTEGSMRFGLRSLLQNVCLRKIACVLVARSSLLQKVLTEGTPGPKISTLGTCWMARRQ